MLYIIMSAWKPFIVLYQKLSAKVSEDLRPRH